MPDVGCEGMDARLQAFPICFISTQMTQIKRIFADSKNKFVGRCPTLSYDGAVSKVTVDYLQVII